MNWISIKPLKLLIPAGLLYMIALSGCTQNTKEFFDKKAIEIHSRDIIREVSDIPPIPDINNPMPSFFLAPPEIKTFGPNDTKLCYFTKNHTPDKMAKLVEAQLGYQVDINPATNQLIVKCPTPEDALIALDFLQAVDVPPIQVRIDCLISEIFADATMDWQTSLQIQDLFGEGGGGIKTVGDAIAATISLTGGGTDGVAFPGAAARDAARSSSGLQVGFASQSSSFKAVIDLLASRGYLKIVMNPTLRTINGKTAKIITKDEVPITKTVTEKDIAPYEITEYKPVTDSLEVTPNVYADGSIGLKTKAMIGSKSTPEGSSQKTIITSREIDIEENRIRPGDSLVIGGIRKSESLGIIRGVPFFEDLPLFGILFSSKDQEEKVKEIMFILTPSISSTGLDYETMAAGIRQKHMKPQLHEANDVNTFIASPFCRSEYAEYVERKAAESEIARIKAESQTAKTRQEMQLLVEQTNTEKARAQKELTSAEQTKAEAQIIKAQAEQVKAEIEKLKAETELLKVQAEQKTNEAKQAQTAAEQKKSEAEKATAAAEQKKVEAHKALSEAEQKITEAEKAKTEAAQRIAEAIAAQTEAERKKSDADKIIAEAEQMKAQSEQMMAEAEKAKADANQTGPNTEPNQPTQ